MEEWRPVKGFEELYEVSNFGRLKKLPCITMRNSGRPLPLKGRIMRGYKNWFGYRRFSMANKDGGNSYAAHRIVAMAFIPNPNNYPQVNHINGIKDDNRVENLEWCNNSMNQIHAYATGLNHQNPLKGEDSNLCKFSEMQIRQVMEALRNGEKQKSIAARFGMSTALISMIKNKKRWVQLNGSKAD